jgi:hypothetical protein
MVTMTPVREHQSYRHEAYLWSDPGDFTDQMGPFIADGLAAGEPVMVAVRNDRARWLRRALGPRAQEVEFVDMVQLGRNPARIIPAWMQFLNRRSSSDRPARGIGEPVWPGRRPVEVAECQFHEALLNVAVDPETPFWLVCPYQTSRLQPEVIAEAHRSHPVILEGDSHRGSPSYGGRGHVEAVFNSAPSQLWGEPASMVFHADNPHQAFAFVTLHATAAGLWSDAVTRLAIATSQVIAAAVRRGASHGSVQIWDGEDSLVCDVSDETVLTDVIAGRRMPTEGEQDGLWTANHLCDLVQLRSGATGTSVRLYAWK